MKNLSYLVLIFLVSCSTNVLFDNDLTSDQKVYVMSILDCDSKQNAGNLKLSLNISNAYRC